MRLNRAPSENDNKWVQKHIYETPDEIPAETSLHDPSINNGDIESQKGKSNKDQSIDRNNKSPSKLSDLR